MALSESARSLGNMAAVGKTASTDAFFVGLGRESFGGFLPQDKAHVVDDLRAARVHCFEMEAGTLFTLGRIFGLKTGAVLAVVANRATDSLELEAGVEDAIDVAVGAVSRLKKYSV